MAVTAVSRLPPVCLSVLSPCLSLSSLTRSRGLCRWCRPAQCSSSVPDACSPHVSCAARGCLVSQMKVTMEKMASVDDRIRWMRELWDMVRAARCRV